MYLFRPGAETTRDYASKPVSRLALKGALVESPDAGDWVVGIFGRKVRETGSFGLTMDTAGKGFVAEKYSLTFDEDWAEANCPILYVCPDELEYWKDHENHTPIWYHRIALDVRRNRFCAQFIAHWPDQFDWLLSRHKWDYEPIFLYYEYTGSDDWSSIQKDARLTYIYYDDGHWSTRKVHPPLLKEENHPVFVLKTGYHAYDPMTPLITTAGRKDDRDLERFSARPKSLSENDIVEWRSRDENPITNLKDLRDPWSEGDGPGEKFD